MTVLYHSILVVFNNDLKADFEHFDDQNLNRNVLLPGKDEVICKHNQLLPLFKMKKIDSPLEF